VTTPGVERKVLLALNAVFDSAILRGVDAVVHCAWDVRPGAAPNNVAGTKRLVEAAEVEGVMHQVFISSSSAHASAVSDYGRSKLAVQDYMMAHGHAVARPGLVIGAGGLFARLSEKAAKPAENTWFVRAPFSAKMEPTTYLEPSSPRSGGSSAAARACSSSARGRRARPR